MKIKTKVKIARAYINVRDILLIIVAAGITLGGIAGIIWGMIVSVEFRVWALLGLGALVAAGIVIALTTLNAWAEEVVEAHK